MKYTTFTVWVALIINEPIVIWIRLRFALDRKQVCASYRYESEHFHTLWDVKDNLPVRTLRGHTNEKNFVGDHETCDIAQIWNTRDGRCRGGSWFILYKCGLLEE
ncbi:BnaC04g43440D [Brassica napus]|uniref:BnaC04g43440D protein n=1 Tax=Brassica napus TaxID=3708 RepID=A0A078GGM1_BRANA|nr:BnaC04g43440D [Brassica napus]